MLNKTLSCIHHAVQLCTHTLLFAQALSSLFLAKAAAQSTPPSVSAIIVAQGRQYRYYGTARTWVDADAACKALPGGSWRLASFSSKQQEATVLAGLDACSWDLRGCDDRTCNRQFWIGLNDRTTEGAYRWPDDSLVSYFGWLPGEPNNWGGNEDCTMALWGSCEAGANWIDASCNDYLRPYLCSRPFTPTPSTAKIVPALGSPAIVARGQLYRYFGAPATWDEASAACRALDGGDWRLASFTSREQEAAVYAGLGACSWDLRACTDATCWRQVWIGANDLRLEGVFLWPTNGLVSYRAWHAGEPNNHGAKEHCAVALWQSCQAGGSWADLTCSHKRPYLCSSPASVPAITQAAVVSINREYRYFYDPLSWTASESACQALGAGWRLASFSNSQQEREVLRGIGACSWDVTGCGTASCARQMWIGLHDRTTEGTFQWSDGRPRTYTAWRAGEPDNSASNVDCTAALYHSCQPGVSWVDINCGLQRPYLCSRQAPPPGPVPRPSPLPCFPMGGPPPSPSPARRTREGQSSTGLDTVATPADSTPSAADDEGAQVDEAGTVPSARSGIGERGNGTAGAGGSSGGGEGDSSVDEGSSGGSGGYGTRDADKAGRQQGVCAGSRSDMAGLQTQRDALRKLSATVGVNLLNSTSSSDAELGDLDRLAAARTGHDTSTHPPKTPKAQRYPPPVNVVRDARWIENTRYRVGLDLMRGAATFHISSAAANAKSVVNAHDEGRLVQQSVYGNDEDPSTTCYNWPWNPIQAGDIWGQRSELIDFRLNVPPQLPGAMSTVHPRNWYGGQLMRDVVMRQEVTLYSQHIHYRMHLVYTGTVTHRAKQQEVPAFYVHRRFAKLYYYDGPAPYTGAAIKSLWPNIWYEWYNGSTQVTLAEKWVILEDPITKEAVGLLVPSAPTAIAFRFGYGDGNPDPHGSATTYVAPIAVYGHQPGMVTTYDFYVATGTVTWLRNFFVGLHCTLGL